ncbi:hypothetical protein MN608_04876 [Microdochium nivale]|nr:hypothetical protein MN608_04876 [Microdochium nivale]
MTPRLPGRKSTLRQRGWSVTVAPHNTQPQAPKTPLNLEKPLPPRPVSFSSSVYSADAPSCRSLDSRHADMTSNQNTHRYGMDVSTILPPAHPECCCDGIDEEDSGESSNPTTPVGTTEPDIGFRLPIYSAYSSSRSLAYASSPKSQRRSNDFRQSTPGSPRTKGGFKVDSYVGASSGQDKENECTHLGFAPQGLGINEVSMARQAITFAGTAPSSYSSRLTARRIPAPPPLKLSERALADSYVRTPYPRSARHMSTISTMSQKSVFEHDDDDEEEEENSPYTSARRRKDSLYAKHFSGLGDLTQSLRRSSKRISMQQNVQEIIPPRNYENFCAPRSPPVCAPPVKAGHRRAATMPSAMPTATTLTANKPRPTTSPPSAGKMKLMLLKAKRSLSFGFVDEHRKRESKNNEALRKMVRNGTTEARLGQNFL